MLTATPQYYIPSISAISSVPMEQYEMFKENSFGENLNNEESCLDDFSYEYVYKEDLKHSVRDLIFLKKNWDGYGAAAVDQGTINNVLKLIDLLDMKVLELLSLEGVNPTPYGTIELDFESKNKGLVSLELSKSKIGYFTDFFKDKNEICDGVNLLFNDIPNEVYGVLNKLR